MTEGLADPLLRATPATSACTGPGARVAPACCSPATCRSTVSTSSGPATWPSTSPSRAPATRRRGGAWQRWARAGTAHGNHLWMQISHAGRQAPRYVTRRPLAPSAVQLELLGNYARPRALTEAEILELIRRFAHAAAIAREAGFTGVQVHGAHGYLISSFLSPVTNRRTDAWGGSLENRARFLLETVRAVRRGRGARFPGGGEAQFRRLPQGRLLARRSASRSCAGSTTSRIDLLEISGGTYEQPRLIGAEGRSRGRRAGAAEHAGARGVFPRLCGGDPPGGAHAADGHGRVPHARRHGGSARARPAIAT